MGLLNLEKRNSLIELLLKFPQHEEAHRRHSLVRNIAPGIRNNIPNNGGPQTHFINIIQAVDDEAWEEPPAGRWPIFTLIDNAIIWAEDYDGLDEKIFTALRTLRKELQEKAVLKVPGFKMQLQEALLSAFSTYRRLRYFLLFVLDIHLAQISSGTNLREVAESLVRWAEKEQMLFELTAAAVTENPHDPYLHAIAAQIGLVDLFPAYSPSTALTGQQIRRLSLTLAHAYTYEELHQIIMQISGRKLERITLRSDLEDITIDLINFAEQYGYTRDLLQAALDAQPDNAALRVFLGSPLSSAAEPNYSPPIQAQPIDPQQLDALQKTFEGLFSYLELQNLVLRTFHKELDLISLRDTLSDVVSDLIHWGIKNDYLTKLVEAARKLRPDNPILLFFPDWPPGENDQQMNLLITLEQALELEKAFISAFTYSELQNFTIHAFNKSLETISLTPTLESVVFALINWAIQNAYIPKLLTMALIAKPNDLALQSAAAAFGVPSERSAESNS